MEENVPKAIKCEVCKDKTWISIVPCSETAARGTDSSEWWEWCPKCCPKSIRYPGDKKPYTKKTIKEEVVLKIAKHLYSKSPNGRYVKKKSTSPIPYHVLISTSFDANAFEFIPDTWEEASDRHNECLQLAKEIYDIIMDT